MATVYLLHTDEATKLPDSYGAALFPLRAERARSFRFLQDRLLCMGAGALLHGMLGIRECSITLGEHGKPCAPDCSVNFNLSHSGEYAVLAVGEHPIGVDVEQCDERHFSVAKRVFTPGEQAWMAEAPAERFMKLWTMKESVSKALGQGLSLPFESFDVLPLLNGEAVTVEDSVLYGETLPLPGYGLSLCTVGARETAELRVLSAAELLK